MAAHDVKKLQKKAATLVEALPYLKKYAGDIFVIKYGGSAMTQKVLSNQFAEDVTLLKHVGIHPVIVHGGGPQIGRMLEQLGIKSSFIDGLRVTCEKTIGIAEMVLSGSINKSIVSTINYFGGRAIGLSGKDGHMVTAEKLIKTRIHPDTGKEETIDLGFVGSPVHVDPKIISESVNSGAIPVIAPIAAGDCGQTYNINADTMAGAIARALKARRLFLLTDVAGVLDENGELLAELDSKSIQTLVRQGVIQGGMIPKTETCLQAIEAGVPGAVIMDGRLKHALLLEVFTERGAGTLIRH